MNQRARSLLDRVRRRPPDGPARSFDAQLAAARSILDFLAGDGLSLGGKAVASVSLAGGALELALARETRPARLTVFGLEPVDADALVEEAVKHGDDEVLPAQLELVTADNGILAADDASYDVVVAWSVLNYVEDPAQLVQEMRRIIAPYGLLFVDVSPLLHCVEDLPGRHGLNPLTVDELGALLDGAGFVVNKVELRSSRTRVPHKLAHKPLSQLLISGARIQATPRLA